MVSQYPVRDGLGNVIIERPYDPSLGSAHVPAMTPDGELLTTNTERETNVHVAIGGLTTVVGTTWYGFVDLSDTVNWPHEATARLDFSVLYLNIDKAAAARGTVSLGIITRIDGTNADVVFLAHNSFTQNDTPSVNIIANLAPTQLKGAVANNRLRDFKTNNMALAVAAINTGVTLPFGPGGASFTPAVGDAVVRVVSTAGGDINWGVAAAYHAH